MKSRILTFTILLSFQLAGSLLHAEQNIADLIEKLDSLPNQENAVLYRSLSQETKDAIAEVRRERARRFQEKFDYAERRKNEFLSAGTFPLGEQIVRHYRELGLQVVEGIADPKEKSKVREHVLETAQQMAERVGEPPPPLVIPVWERNKEWLEKLWKSFEWDEADIATLKIVEEAFQPILHELQEIADAEPEQDKPWFVRKKWRSLLVVDEEEEEPDKPKSSE